MILDHKGFEFCRDNAYEIAALTMDVNEEKRILKEAYIDEDPTHNPLGDSRLYKLPDMTSHHSIVRMAQRICEIICVIRHSVDNEFMMSSKLANKLLELFGPIYVLKELDVETLKERPDEYGPIWASLDPLNYAD